MIGDYFDFDAWKDTQRARPTGKCVCCGREIYTLFSDTCPICLMDIDVENE